MFKRANQNSQKTVPLLTYWTGLYVLVLILSLFLLATISGIWIKINVYNQQYDLLELRALQIAEAYERMSGDSTQLDRIILQDRPLMMGKLRTPLLVQIVDQEGNVHSGTNIKSPVAFLPTIEETPPEHRMVLDGKIIREQVKIDSQTWLRVGVPLSWNGTIHNALYISSPTRGILEHVIGLYISLAVLTGIIGLAGWMVLYFLSRKLTRPLLQVSAAAQSIASGKYDVLLPQQPKEQELQQLITSFKNMADQLNKLEQLRTGLLAGVSHELRTPITSIRGMIQAVQSKVVDGEEAERFIKISLDEAKRLQKMVEELLDFSSLESGATPIENEDVNFSELVEEVIQQLLVLDEFKNVRFEQNLPVDAVIIKGDTGRLRQVMFNLFSNSLKASAKTIKVTLMFDKQFVAIDINDDGKGVSLYDQPYIFERFYRGGDGRVKARGLGLGLTISRLLARAHGGELILREDLPGSTTFRLTLPCSKR